MSTMTRDFTFRLMDAYDNMDPFSGCSYTERMRAAFQADDILTSGNKEDIRDLIKPLQMYINEADPDDPDLPDYKRLLDDIRTYAMLEPDITEAMAREFLAGRTDDDVIAFRQFEASPSCAYVWTLSKYAAIVREWILRVREEDGTIAVMQDGRILYRQ